MPDEGGLRLGLGFETSAAEFIAARTAATVVKSLNQIGAAVLGDAGSYPVRPIQFVAGDNAAAKRTGTRLVGEPRVSSWDWGSGMRGRSRLRACWSRWRWSGSTKQCVTAWSPTAPGR